MANRDWNRVRAAKDEADQKVKELAYEMKMCCFHKDNGPGEHRALRNIWDVDNAYATSKKASSTTVICTGPDGCGRIFEGGVYTSEQVDAAQFQIMSMVEQLKFNSRSVSEFPGGEALLDDCNTAVEVIGKMCRVYKSIISEKDKKNNRNRQNRQNDRKGSFGMPKLYGGREI